MGHEFEGSKGRMTQTVSGSKRAQGEAHAKNSLIFGIIGFFVLGFVFGPLALIQASKAEKLGVSATAGKVLGWVDIIVLVLSIVGGFILYGGLMAAGGSSV